MYKKSTSDTWAKIGKKYGTQSTGSFIPDEAETYDIMINVKDSTGKIESKSFTVSVYVKPSNIALSSTSTTMINGTTKTLTATVYPFEAENKNVTWTSSNNTVAVVNSNGVITAKSSGTATITTTTVNGLKASC